MQKKYFGTVVQGLGKGKEFGFQTANIELIDNKLDIENGVYVVMIELNNRTLSGMLYAGTRPTLHLRKTTIEIHIFDFNEDIYNLQISFQILHKIRDEIHFKSIENLIEQLHRDKKTVYDFLQNPNL